MKLLITGATGLVGKALVEQCLEGGHEVHFLTTSKSKVKSNPKLKGFFWNPKQDSIDMACFDGVDVIVHLAGASISKRWTTSHKQNILSSRIDTAKFLFEKLKASKVRVPHFISASAIGIYPSSVTNYYEEVEQKTSTTFLGEVVEVWESAANIFKDLDMKVSKVRIGLVLDSSEGALPALVKPMKYGFGAAFGTGMQWQSWIHIWDLAAIFLFIAENKLEGVFNAVAPNPVTNTELTKTAAALLNKPLWLPNIPQFAMKLALGDMHILLFESQRVSASKIQSEGFEFAFPNLEPALEDLL
ncbi:MAG TPA: TIGR01777 family oxidoreductase [Flavobacteriaceae bacterium]|nr:TIGR01777 family oxidoreductase [Flavobacteriaceae bacterium]